MLAETLRQAMLTADRALHKRFRFQDTKGGRAVYRANMRERVAVHLGVPVRDFRTWLLEDDRGRPTLTIEIRQTRVLASIIVGEGVPDGISLAEWKTLAEHKMTPEARARFEQMRGRCEQRIDNRTVSSIMLHWGAAQREVQASVERVKQFTPAQRDYARTEWSRRVKARAEAGRKDRELSVDDDRWDE